jgi:hypothetical protein
MKSSWNRNLEAVRIGKEDKQLKTLSAFNLQSYKKTPTIVENNLEEWEAATR